ncbi:hypothetical protein DPMN_028310 [Dreissena polymorpha]|uniref:Uncharacterized protein n=1 Tax=Dreissena polymorpha TaxID=45954 RepID=A0A9D4LYS0_DREPO|nr:hypothetical protein DPMN_028310 [Dreissena polymorpha]
MSKFNSKLEALEQANTLLITENSDLKANISLLESKLDDQEQYSRRNLVRVSGIQENQSENTDDLIMYWQKYCNAGTMSVLILLNV